MPEYTKEQVLEAKLYFQGKGCYEDGGFTEAKTVKYSSILLAALYTTERERDEEERHCGKALDERDEADECVSNIAALCGREISSSFGYQDLVNEVEEIIESAKIAEQERDALKAQCAGMEGRLEGIIKAIDVGEAHSVKRIRKMLVEVLNAMSGEKEG